MDEDFAISLSLGVLSVNTQWQISVNRSIIDRIIYRVLHKRSEEQMHVRFHEE